MIDAKCVAVENTDEVQESGGEETDKKVLQRKKTKKNAEQTEDPQRDRTAKKKEERHTHTRRGVLVDGS